MSLSEAKLAAFESATRAARLLTGLMPRETISREEAAQLERAARQLMCAAEEVSARVKGIPEPIRGE